MSYRRIACLSTEAVETLYLIGAEDCIAGISGFTTRPARARKEKPRISGYSSARLERILAVQPDIAIGFSDLQADIARDLIAAGIEVHVYNQRDIAGILRMIANLARLVDRKEAGERLVKALQDRIAEARLSAQGLRRRPRVYFEEWNEPLICGIGWVSELIGIAGGIDCFETQSRHGGARERIIADPMEVVRQAPDIIIGSWCGRKFRSEEVRARVGWEDIPAVRHGELHEIKSADILSPGPGAIQDGLARLQAIVADWSRRQGAA